MDKEALVQKLLYKSLKEYHSILDDFEYGRYPIDYSFVFEELMFMKLLDLDVIEDAYYNTTIQYFLNNARTNKVFAAKK